MAKKIVKTPLRRAVQTYLGLIKVIQVNTGLSLLKTTWHDAGCCTAELGIRGHKPLYTILCRETETGWTIDRLDHNVDLNTIACKSN